MSDTALEVRSNGHGTQVEPSSSQKRTAKPKGEPALPTVQFRPDTKRRFVAAAEKCGLGLTDAADLATTLLEDVAADEEAETVEQRKERLRRKGRGSK